MDTTLQDPLIGHVLDGRYRVESRIAVGGMATVYRAVDTRLDRVLALKVMHSSLVEDSAFVERFIREAKSAARLAHPNVVAVFDQGTDGAYVYLAMEYVAGCTLRDLLRERRVLQPRATLDIMEPILAALGAAHRAQLVHRDMKPENVLVGEDGRVKVADFGLVGAVDAQTSTSTNTVMGTVSYLAPERIEHGIAGTTADIYACGVMLYEMLVGAKPHSGTTPAQVLYQHLRHDVRAPSAAVPGLATALDGLVVRACARDRGQRPADAVDMLVELRKVRAGLTDEQLDAVPPQAPGREPGESARPRSSEDTTAAEDGPTTVIPRPATARNSLDQNRTRVLTRPPAGPPEDGAAPPAGFRSGRPRRSLPALVGAVLLVLGLGAGLWYINSGQFLRTPSVLRMTQAEAERTLGDVGLRVKVAEEYSSTIDRGRVIGSDPGPSDRVRGNGTVTITVSQGPDVVRVPDLEGVPLAEARKRLEKAELEPATVSREFSEKIGQGSVIRTTPEAGVGKRPGSAVTLTVSEGGRLELPDVLGLDQDAARAALREAGFKVKIAPARVFSGQEENTVAEQSPAAAASGATGDTVTLTLSKGPEPVTVPEVVGQDEDTAVKTLEEAGLGVTVRRIFLTGKVFNQSVSGGDQAEKGTTVTIWVR